MGNIGDTFAPTVPIVGTAGPVYATQINAVLAEVITRLSVRVPLSSLNLNSTFNLGGNPVTNVGYITLANATNNPSGVPSPANRITAFSGDLYYVSPSGAVQITTGAALNSASIGGITGTYGGASPAQFRHDAVNTRYDAFENFSTNTWAYIRALGFDIAAGATSAVFARLLFAGGTNKTFTLPSSVASADTRPLHIDSSGNITTGFTTKELCFSPFLYQVFSGVASDVGLNLGASGIETKTTNGPQIFISLPGLQVGTRITSVVLKGTKGNTSLTSIQLRRLSTPGSPVFSTSSTTAGANTYTLTGSAHTVLTNENYYVAVTFPTIASDSINQVSVFFDQPA